MRVFHSPASVRHAPAEYYRRGAIVAHPEQAQRYTLLHDAVVKAGHDVAEAGDRGIVPIQAVHDAGYLEFLETAWARRAEIPGFDKDVGSSHFARPQMSRRPTGLLGQIGFHMADTSTPIQAGTWDAIYGAAQAAIAASEHVAMSGAGVAYALCRPPGHHAYADSAGGFCFLNNTAIAARHLGRLKAARVAILDIDVHHGNGTQGIFYESDDVLTVSVHAAPDNYFPFYTGYADETGRGAGKGLNVNIPLAEGRGDAEWLAAIGSGLERIRDFAPGALVVALGFDASEHDPIGAFKITTAGFEAAARAIAESGLPTVLVQEGGYLSDVLADNLVQFLAAFEAAQSISG